MNTKNITFILTLIIVLGAAVVIAHKDSNSGVVASPQENILDNQNWLTYKDAELGIEMKYPKSVMVSSKRANDMKEAHEYGFYLEHSLGRIDITLPSTRNGLHIYVYDMDVATLFEKYSSLNKSSTDTAKSVPLGDLNLIYLAPNGNLDEYNLLHYQRAYFAGNNTHAYEIVPEQIPKEEEILFENILKSIRLGA